MELAATARSWGQFTRRRPIGEVLLFLGVGATSFLILPFWFVHLIPCLPICVAVRVLGRKRVQWTNSDFAILVVPDLAWIALTAIGNLPKSLANAAVELFYLGVGAAVAPIIRFVLPKRWNAKIVAATLLIVACAVAAAIYFTVPCLPE